jgi:hypothetical protein
MEYAVEMGSSAIIKTGCGIQKLMGGEGIHRHTNNMEITCAYFHILKLGK